MKIKLFPVIAVLVALIVISAGKASEIKFIEAKYGEKNPMSKKILVAYASKSGSTAEVADFIGKTFAAKGANVDVMQIENVGDISGYKAVVIGSAIRRGKVLPDVSEFASKQKKNLQGIPVAYFLLCTTLQEDTTEKRKKAAAYLDPLCVDITPVDKGLFAGKMDYSKLDSISKFIIKNLVRTPEGDFRNWDAIAKWSDLVYPKLISSKI